MKRESPGVCPASSVAARAFAIVALALFLMTLAGCSDATAGVPVRGNVILKGGGPLEEGRIVLIPDPFDVDEPQGVATLERDGSFNCNSYTGEAGVPPGRYRVTLLFPSAKGKLHPLARSFARYTKYETTPLVLDVPETGLTGVLLELEELEAADWDNRR